MPMSLFRNRNFAVASVLGFLVGFAMFGATTFLPQYQQLVQGDSATASGLALIPLMLSSVVVGLIVGQITTRTGRYRAFPIIGGALMTLGMIALAQLTVSTTTHTVSSLLMIPLGLGMGFLMQTTMLITQNSVSVRDMGVASSAATFFRQIGGSIGVSLFGAIFSSRLTASLTSSLGSAAAGENDLRRRADEPERRVAPAGRGPHRVQFGRRGRPADGVLVGRANHRRGLRGGLVRQGDPAAWRRHSAGDAERFAGEGRDREAAPAG